MVLSYSKAKSVASTVYSSDIFIARICFLNLNVKTELIIILFIVQCWTQASKPEPLKQDTQKEKKKINLYSTI